MDLSFASKRFCSTEGVENLQVLSDYREKCFSTSYWNFNCRRFT